MKFVFDLDGTICFKGQPITQTIFEALSELSEFGIEVIFASARPIRDMLPVIDEAFHDYTLIGGNGSLISKKGKIITANTFSESELLAIKRLINEYNATYLIDSAWDYAYTGPETHPILQNLDPGNLAKRVTLSSLDSVVKVLLLTSDRMIDLSKKLVELNVYVNEHGKENVLDISPNGINKWSALESLGVQEQTYIAFGNDANDRSMFKQALHSVMIGNHEDLEIYAKESVPLVGNYEQAIATKIRELAEKYKTI